VIRKRGENSVVLHSRRKKAELYDVNRGMAYVEQVEGEKGLLGHFKDGAHINFLGLNLDGIRHLIVRAGCLDTKGAKLELRKDSPTGALLAIGLASFCSDLTLPGAWGACMDVGGRHTGALSGSMNMMGNAGGAVAPMVVPLVLKATHDNWNVNIALFAIACFLAAACWWFVDSDERMHE